MILLVAGTRPEIIKMAPVYVELAKKKLDPAWLYTQQSPDLGDDTFAAFGLKPDVTLDCPRQDGSLGELNAVLSAHMHDALKRLKPSMVLVQGDTLSAAVGATVAFLSGIPTGHVEAGLRSWDIHSPYPEEMCRTVIDTVATQKYAPTTQAAATLTGEVYVTGNTVCDALRMVEPQAGRQGRYAVVTMHRRENAQDVKRVCSAIRQIAKERLFDYIVWPVHPNPAVRNVVPYQMQGLRTVEVVSPLRYDRMVNLVRGAKMLITDSGGLQEEALGLGVPCLVMRKETERPEGIAVGGAKLVGTDRQKIVGWTRWLMTNNDEWETMASAVNPYGDGRAAGRIAAAVKGLMDGKKPEYSKTNWTPPRLART